jgi:hypothetical protein
VVDHIEPISRRSDLALAQSNLWSLCPRCANKVTVMFDLPGSPMRYRADSGCDEQGHPLDRLHAWNQPDGRTPDIRSKRQLVDLLRRLPVRPIAQRPSLQPASRSGSAPRR